MKFFEETTPTTLVMGFSGTALALSNITILVTGETIIGSGDSTTKSSYIVSKTGAGSLVNAVP